MVYRSPLDEDDSRFIYAEWLRELRNANGAYVVRDADSREVLYVGESHSSQMYKTITRHFQAWRGYTAGTDYDPDAVQVAVTKTPPNSAPGHQLSLIEDLDPRDNVYGAEDEGLEASEFADDPDEFAPF